MNNYLIFVLSEFFVYLCRNLINFKAMKKTTILTTAFFLAMSVMQAQNIPTGIRMEITTIEQNKNEYELFTYKDNDGTFGYYLSLGRVVKLMDIFIDPEFTNTSFDHIDETCLCLGSTYDEAYDKLGKLLDLCKEEVGTEHEYVMRASKGVRLGEVYSTVCRVVKKPLGGKRLDFFFAKGTFTCDLYLSKSAIKQLRWGLKIDKKLHPKQHKLQ